MARMNKITLQVSGRNTGKTTFYVGSDELKVKGMINMYLNSHANMNVIIIDTVDNNKYTHIPKAKSLSDLKNRENRLQRIITSEIDLIWKIISDNIYNCCIIIEDAYRFIGKTLTKEQISILIDCKQKNNDLFFTYHALMQVAPDLIRLSDYLVLGKTNENFTSSIRDKFPIPDFKTGFDKVKNHKSMFYRQTFNLS